MTKKKILMIIGDYVEDYEVMVPFQCLEMVGHIVHVVSPDKKSGDFCVTAVHDFLPGEQTYTELRGHRFKLNFDFAAVKECDYDALVIPGGRAPEFLRLNAKVIELTQQFHHSKKPIASICHGPQILAAAGVLKGIRCTSYPACKPELILAGANFQDTAADKAVSDHNIVSAVAWPGHSEWLALFLEKLGTKITL
ncbi:DJ-1/ThiJ/PfpI family protein [Heterostelium album PN500]|uniref:DJ-1/ThiJ/PfpI family protein n=1 Tax=Heterostelium pallidum (strain ATCC 26659 / Pp 5 / PN500) TaxID=670386 RepID=D3BBC8_HETP5|nr:DJ-1/ThiJ/PfpI family protein [Heterostelium album PN500]EFA81335.1 DJ-1/ThiJ/PfpI family protein [Heterostelium album PN500]|eukprot:XP_020433453.1 DJ-1/ThiJ/PfpI family protein [Heterostelium album PN500]